MRSVEILVREGQLHILDLSVVTLLFQVAWGSLFASFLGLSFGVVRLSTFVMVLLGGLATYGLCRELQIARIPSALAAAAYLFNPLSFVLTYTFMSDPHFTALLVIATYGYVRGCELIARALTTPPWYSGVPGCRLCLPRASAGRADPAGCSGRSPVAATTLQGSRQRSPGAARCDAASRGRCRLLHLAQPGSRDSSRGAGVAWDGYVLYDYGLAHGLTQQTPGGPWWTNLFAPATTSDWVV